MTKQATTKENINKLIEFRQAVYEQGIAYRRDAIFDLLNAMIWGGSVSSFAMLSQADPFQRKWPSVYAAVEDGRLNEDWLQAYLTLQVILRRRRPNTACTGQVRAFRRTFGESAPTADSASGGFVRQFPPCR